VNLPADGERVALFPDTVSERATTHLRELGAVAAAGGRAACLFIVQRADCSRFAPCVARDPAYAAACDIAAAAGVQLLAAAVEPLPDFPGGGAVSFLRLLPVDLRHGRAASACV
jgi:sugar fermentation stimulation protein A